MPISEDAYSGKQEVERSLSHRIQPDIIKQSENKEEFSIFNFFSSRSIKYIKVYTFCSAVISSLYNLEE